MLQLTDEQQRVVESEDDAKVEALAGTGKTTTLIHYARHHRKSGNILYLVFNRAMRDDAEGRFPRNVKVSTAHSLAWHALRLNGRDVNRTFGAHDVIRELKLKNDQTGRLLAKSVLELFRMYCYSSKEAPEEAVDPLVEHLGTGRLSGFIRANQKRVSKLADKLFVGMQTRRIPQITDDFYFKQFALEKAESVLAWYDIVLADEAQDHNEVTARILIDSGVPTVFVGDSLQQIYAWRYAVNTLKKVPEHQEFSLTGAFRFGEEIADVVNRVITNLRGEELTIRGLGPESEIRQYEGDRPRLMKGWAYLSRTNGELLKLAEDAISTGWSLYIEGGVDSLQFKAMYHILQLLEGKKPKHPFFALFADIDELQDYCEVIDDRSTLSLIGIVKKYRRGLFDLEQGINQSMVHDKTEADVALSTAHKAKGLEFKKVALLDNFAGEIIDSDDEIDLGDWRKREEINLLYVAMTRAKKSLMLPARVVDAKPVRTKNGDAAGRKEATSPSVHGVFGDDFDPFDPAWDGSLPAFLEDKVSTSKTIKSGGKRKGARFPPVVVIKQNRKLKTLRPTKLFRQSGGRDGEGRIGIEFEGTVWPIVADGDSDAQYAIFVDDGEERVTQGGYSVFNLSQALDRAGLEPYEQTEFEDAEELDPTLIDENGNIVSYRKLMPAYVLPNRQYGVEFHGLVWPVWTAQDDWVAFISEPDEGRDIEECICIKDLVSAENQRVARRRDGPWKANCFRCHTPLYGGMDRCTCGWIECPNCGACGCMYQGS